MQRQSSVLYVSGIDAKPMLRCCRKCRHIEDVSEDTENVSPSYVCHKRPHITNLRGLPFETELECFKINGSFC